MKRVLMAVPLFALLVVHCSWFAVPAEDVAPAALFTDNMVLQRDIELPVWGRATPKAKVTVIFKKQKIAALADENGEWSVTLAPESAGGPFDLKIVGKDSIILSNILIGEVWICSGQSNMEWSVSNSNNAEEEIAAADYPNIRLFQVNHATSLNHQDDVDAGGWQACSPATVPGFSAVGYFFGRTLHEELGIPIGLIKTAWGGTIAEAWTAGEFLREMDDFAEVMDSLQTTATTEEELQAEYEAKVQAWQQAVDAKIANAQEGGPAWEHEDVDETSWDSMELPVLWESAGLPGFDGIAWFRTSFELDSTFNGNFTLSLGPIDDQDITFINGVKIGATGVYNTPREYTVPDGLLKPGKNVVAVQALDTGGGGGIWGDASQMWLKNADESTNIDLSGEWKYKVGVSLSDVPPRPASPDSPNRPTVLYNAMLEPLMPYAIRGAIWYQGESNATRAYQYRELFPTMINSWRANWSQGDFPFYFVQLANFRQVRDLPVESDWAELREAQSMTLSLPNTGQAVIIDIGDADDIHPKNKQDVGKRLALNALALDYGQDIVYSGPVYTSMSIDDNRIKLIFDHVGGGLVAKDGDLSGFAIAGEDKKFVWAEAVIDGNTVVVSSPEVDNPVAVRYAWADNPVCNLYNTEGLPASPFRTDEWDGITKGVK